MTTSLEIVNKMIAQCQKDIDKAESKAVEIAKAQGANTAQEFLKKAYSVLEPRWNDLQKLAKSLNEELLYIASIESDNFNKIVIIRELELNLQFSEIAAQTYEKALDKIHKEEYGQTLEEFYWSETNFSKFSIFKH